MGLRQKIATLIVGAGICYCVAESTDHRDLDFSTQYLDPGQMLTTLRDDNYANVIGAVGFDAFVIGAAYSLLAGNKKKSS